MAELAQTDVSRPSALPTANLLHKSRADAQTQGIADQQSDRYLDSVEEEWNKKVDAEVDILVEGMVDLVGLASVRLKVSDTISININESISRLPIRTSFLLRKRHFKLSAGRNPWCAPLSFNMEHDAIFSFTRFALLTRFSPLPIRSNYYCYSRMRLKSPIEEMRS